jgi:hypothetical protein
MKCLQILRGTVVIEFAILAPVLILLLVGGMEVAIYAYNQFVFEAALQDVAHDSYNTAVKESQIPSKFKTAFDVKAFFALNQGSLSTQCSDITGSTYDLCKLSYPYKFVTPYMESMFSSPNLTASARFNFKSSNNKDKDKSDSDDDEDNDNHGSGNNNQGNGWGNNWD